MKKNEDEDGHTHLCCKCSLHCKCINWYDLSISGAEILNNE